MTIGLIKDFSMGSAGLGSSVLPQIHSNAVQNMFLPCVKHVSPLYKLYFTA